jgi:hypothetical protein
MELSYRSSGNIQPEGVSLFTLLHGIGASNNDRDRLKNRGSVYLLRKKRFRMPLANLLYDPLDVMVAVAWWLATLVLG